MKKSVTLIITLTICVLFVKCIQADISDDLYGEKESDVKIVLTKFDVNDTNLKLGFKIINNTDHDVWICDGLHPGDYTERFLDTDNETLVLRRRFDLPFKGAPISKVFQSSYIRLRSGHEKVDSVSLDVPVEPQRLFG